MLDNYVQDTQILMATVNASIYGNICITISKLTTKPREIKINLSLKCGCGCRPRDSKQPSKVVGANIFFLQGWIFSTCMCMLIEILLLSGKGYTLYYPLPLLISYENDSLLLTSSEI